MPKSHVDIIRYWFSDRLKKHWFASTPELDAEIRKQFESDWLAAAEGQRDAWRQTPEGALALIIVLDQFPLNMYRGMPKSFSTEAKAIEVCKRGIDAGFGEQLKKEHLGFFFMPLMHSENLTDQGLSVSMYERHGLAENLRFAQHHRDIVRRFGRFPHRNAILGRESTPEELEYLASKDAFKG